MSKSVLFSICLKNDRVAKTLTVHVRAGGDGETALSRSCPLSSYKADTIARIALSLITSTNSASGSTDRWSVAKVDSSTFLHEMRISSFLVSLKINIYAGYFYYFSIESAEIMNKKKILIRVY